VPLQSKFLSVVVKIVAVLFFFPGLWVFMHGSVVMGIVLIFTGSGLGLLSEKLL